MQIFIATADKTLRLALLLLLESEPGLVVTGLSDRAHGLPVVMETAQPEVLLLDYELSGRATADLICALKRLISPPRIIVLAMDSQAKEKVLACGAAAVIDKNMPPDNLLPILIRMRSSDINKQAPTKEKEDELHTAFGAE